MRPRIGHQCPMEKTHMSKRPVIGITPSPADDVADHGTFRRYCLSNTYVDSIRRAGGLPVILPESETEFEAVLATVDGLLFSGGSDLDPALYGDTTVHETTYGIDPERDTFEIGLFRLAHERDVPVLGICRGIQTINVALGGTLIQDIDAEIQGNTEHRQHKNGKSRTDVSHTVTVADDQNPLFAAVGEHTFQVNSFHHQSVKEPAPGFRIAATSEDGVIEALWHPDMRFCLAVQWHPEMLADRFPDHAAIFDAFVNATRSAIAPEVTSAR